MLKKSKIEIIPWKQTGWRKIGTEKISEETMTFLEPLIDKFGCEILAVKEGK